MTRKRYTFVLNFGYVESASLSFMPWTTNMTFMTAKEALINLAAFLKDQYLIENGYEPKKCCLVSKTKDPATAFCSKCGHDVREKIFNGEEFTDWLRDISTCDIDSFAGYITWDPEHPWKSSLEGEPNQRFVYQAEWVLAAAVGHPLREGRTFDVICKERTKNRKESFSYY